VFLTHACLGLEFVNPNKSQEATKPVAVNGRVQKSPNLDTRWGWRFQLEVGG